ncbi:MAG: monovalent cation/H(+) antiporter subunit G [Spirochaetota bacterium]|nr:monovalent cation/H(+) antiporter subunit G [Spirochaetota bacterium]
MVIVAKILVVAGVFFFFTSVIGLLRFPDFYSRMHATGKGDTLGALLILVGLAIYNLHHGFAWLDVVQSIKLLLIAVFWLLAGPTATHALLRSAYNSGIKPWTKDNKAVVIEKP